MSEIIIKDRKIGLDNKPFIIAEMSGNHNHSLEAALKIVNEYGYVIYLVGDETQISNLLESKNYDKSLIHIVKSDSVIEDVDNPLKALREKPNVTNNTIDKILFIISLP